MTKPDELAQKTAAIVNRVEPDELASVLSALDQHEQDTVARRAERYQRETGRTDYDPSFE